MKNYPKIYISLVNYNSWKETIECIKSLLSNNYSSFEIIIVDNKSINESVAQIDNWLSKNKIECSILDNSSKRNSLDFIKSCTVKHTLLEDVTINIVLIASGINTGFAGGNNIALEYIHTKKDVDFVWLLNNDTVVDSDSLFYQVKFYRENADQRIGILGSKIRYYHAPDTIQCIGGSSYNRWIGYSKQIGNNQIDTGQYDRKIEKLDLIIGASMLMKWDFVKRMSYLDERFFLYFEEQDLAKIALDNGYSIAYSAKSVIYHKEGKTIGASNLQGKTLFSDFYYTRSKILFTYKYYSFLNRFTIRASVLFTIAKRIISGKVSHIPLLVRLMMMPVEQLKNKSHTELIK